MISYRVAIGQVLFFQRLRRHIADLAMIAAGCTVPRSSRFPAYRGSGRVIKIVAALDDL
jgi:hypothetical protein